MSRFRLGEDDLTFETVGQFSKGELNIELTPSKIKELKKAREYVLSHIGGEHAYYGINTDFGSLANTRIGLGRLEELQVNLVRSHAFGVGELMDAGTVRLMMLLRAHVLAMGYSGADPGIPALLIGMMQKNIVPAVPSKGSVGASGDLSPLAHLALALIGEGEVFLGGCRMPASEALKKAGLAPVILGPKDGLSLINGTQAMTAIAALAVMRIEKLMGLMDAAAALSVEGLRCSVAPFDADVHEARGQKGQMETAETLRALLEGSEISASHKDCSRVQDPYSLRCVPQVHGAVRDAYRYARDVVGRELNACTDNPLVFAEEKKIVSGGNFHGEPLAIACDVLAIAVSELGSISERRIEQMTNPKDGALPVMFLTPDPGLSSGFMIPHVVASSLVSENKTLAHPASVDSIPTSADQEDHVSMGMWAAQKLVKIVENVEWICVIEMLAACQAIDLHEMKFRQAPRTKAFYDLVRGHVRFIAADRYLMPEAKKLHEALF